MTVSTRLAGWAAAFVGALIVLLAAAARADDAKLTVMVFGGGQNLALFAAQAKGFFTHRWPGG